MKKCILCNDNFSGWGHNPYPLAPSHFECCSVCNDTRVVPFRIYQLTTNTTDYQARRNAEKDYQ